MSLTLLYLSIYQDAQEQHGDNQIGIVQQLHKEGMWWHHCWLQFLYNYPDHWYHIAVVLIRWFTHALFDKNKIHKRLTITGNKKVCAFYWVCVTVFSSGIIFISIFISWCCPSIRFLSLFPRSTWRRSDGNADSWTATPRSRCLTYNLLVHRTKPSRYQLKFSAFKTPDCFGHKNSAKNFDGEMH